MINVRINEVLSQKDKSIYWLAEQSGLAYPTVFNLVKNKTASISFDTLDKIMKALEIKDINKIIEYKEKD